MKKSSSVLVIGGGISGLAVSSLLAKNGWKVTLLEKNSTFGGRARTLQKEGFHFDMGPSWYMMPEVFEEFFGIFNKTSDDFYKLIRLNPRYQVFYGTNESYILEDDIQKNKLLFESIEKGAGKQLEVFLAKQKKIYENVTKNLLYENVHDLKKWLSYKNIYSLLKLLITSSFWKSWHQEVSSCFDNPRLQQIVEFPSMFLGGSPFDTPGIYSMLSWADFGKGIWYPYGGMSKVIDALVTLAKENKVELLSNSEVTKLNISNGKIDSVETLDSSYSADIVIGAADLPYIETQLIPIEYQTYPRTYWDKKELGISALLIYIGLDTRLKDIAHHTLYFSKDWKKNFQQISAKHFPDDPSFYVSTRSMTDRSIVPEGCEELFFLVPLGASSQYDSKTLEAYSSMVLKKFEMVTGSEISSHIRVKEMFGPNEFAASYNAFQGTALGLAHTWTQSLWMRPANKSKKIKNLYYAGQYTNPGVGVPMAIVSARILSQTIGKPYDK